MRVLVLTLVYLLYPCVSLSLQVRFIEYMPFDGNKWSDLKMMSYVYIYCIYIMVYWDRVRTLPLSPSQKTDTSATSMNT